MSYFFEKAIMNLDRFLKESRWFGREREVVNLFAHRFLPAYLGRDDFLSLEQIGIEVALVQVAEGGRRKKMVNKDLVIWRPGDSSVWNERKEAVNMPLIVAEWKVNDLDLCINDVDWLRKYTREYPSVIGYSVCSFIKHNRGVLFSRIEKGRISRPFNKELI